MKNSNIDELHSIHFSLIYCNTQCSLITEACFLVSFQLFFLIILWYLEMISTVNALIFAAIRWANKCHCDRCKVYKHVSYNVNFPGTLWSQQWCLKICNWAASSQWGYFPLPWWDGVEASGYHFSDKCDCLYLMLLSHLTPWVYIFAESPCSSRRWWNFSNTWGNLIHPLIFFSVKQLVSLSGFNFLACVQLLQSQVGW